MCVCVCVCVYIYIYIYIYIYTHTHKHIHASIYLDICIFVYMLKNVYVMCVHAYMPTSKYLSVFMYLHVCVWINFNISKCMNGKIWLIFVCASSLFTKTDPYFSLLLNTETFIQRSIIIYIIIYLHVFVYETWVLRIIHISLHCRNITIY